MEIISIIIYYTGYYGPRLAAGSQLLRVSLTHPIFYAFLPLLCHKDPKYRSTLRLENRLSLTPRPVATSAFADHTCKSIKQSVQFFYFSVRCLKTGLDPLNALVYDCL